VEQEVVKVEVMPRLVEAAVLEAADQTQLRMMVEMVEVEKQVP
jgi:hypothetical protein